MLDHPPSISPPPLDDLDEPLAPQRSPSRLDFCMEDIEGGGDSPMERMDWSITSFRDHFSYTFVEEDAPPVDIAPSRLPRLLTVEDPEDDPPQAVSHAHEHTDAPPLFFASSDSEPMDEVAIKPQAPIPVRPLSVPILQADEPECITPSRIVPQRLNYTHHGFSRSALLQQKTLWHSRYEEWLEWRAQMEQGEARRHESDTDDAYAGLVNSKTPVVATPPPYMRTPLSGLERDLVDHPPRGRELDVNASVFPRMGDISALRDPYAINIDRSLHKLPSWTLQKALFRFDMQRRSGPLAVTSAPMYNAEHILASISSSTLSSYSSSTLADDEESDSTLVADDSPVSKNQRPLEPLTCTSSPSSPHSWSDACGQEFSWRARWEVLIDIFQPNYIRYDALHQTEMAPCAEARVALPSPPERIFRFTIGNDGDEDDDDDDEETDYGTVITDSSFSIDFDEECERALAFYRRELKSSEVTW